MPLFLIGFMAAGKTSVGRALAAATGRKFLDLDDVVAEMGEPVAQLVARDLAEFRRREATALDRVLGEDAVIATGGGAATFGDNLEKMRGAGLVVALGVDVDEARRRAGDPATRPLLADADRLARERAPVYRRAHAVVSTDGKSIAQVTDEVAHVERVWSTLRCESTPHAERSSTIISLGERSYAITTTAAIDPTLVASQLGSPSKLVVIADKNTARYAFVDDPIVIEPGEASKSFETYQALCNECIRRGLDRNSAIVAVGGGVVGDLAGFVAATLFRGIPIVQIPTTLVAMTDAAIGGKTAIDVPAGKNLVGAFHQPRLVACATDTLATLPARERRAGFGELWKYALLDGRDLWAAVAACAAWAAGPDDTAPPRALRGVIDRAIAYKAAIVGRDERERTGQRALLNLGHTVGHAIETASGMLHGEAVGLGLVAACQVSAAVLGVPDLSNEVADALASSGLPNDPSPWFTDDVLGRVGVDKKRTGRNLKFIAIREVGLCEPVEIAVTELPRILRRSMTP
jgi:shikimate kinase / 3-dehydroquinate synthase